MMLGALLDRVKAHPSHSVAFAAAFLPFIIYLDTRARVWALDTLYAIDSAEMVLAATTLGVDHPPGHPLYLILAHLFSKLPFPLPDEGVILTSGKSSAPPVGSPCPTSTGALQLSTVPHGWRSPCSQACPSTPNP